VMGAVRAVRDLTRAALDPGRPGTLGDLVRVVARATDSRGAVLWEAPDEPRGDLTLSVLALWVGDLPPDAVGRAVAADPITALALGTQSLVVPEDVGGTPALVYSEPVTAAVPIEYTDGGRGVLTLLGGGELSSDAFDTAVELVEILPELCSAVRERQTLALVNACNTILHDADIESPGQPLSRERLGEHLSRVCDLVAEALHCAEVSIFLEEPNDQQSDYRLLAASAGACRGSHAQTTEPVDLVRSGLAEGDEPLMEVRLFCGGTVSGLLRCRGSSGPPHHFTESDLALLHPIAAQVSRYWRNWLQRRAIRDENDSWRGLAEGMTSFNKLITEKLGGGGRDRRHAQQVSEVAVQIVRDVVAESTGATVFRATQTEDGTVGLVPEASAGAGSRTAPIPVSGGPVRVLRSRMQHSTTDAVELSAERVAAGSGWLLSTPIRVGEQVYGVLEAVGPDARLPANSAQVHEIIADQIGLHRHLQDTLGHLHDARQRLEVARRTEAEAMEDLKHQLVSPLRTAASRAELVLTSRRFDPRAEGQLKAIRGLCRKASRVAMSAGVFAMLSKGELPAPKLEPFGVEDMLRTLIAAADDAQVLGDPRRGITFDVERDTVRRLERRLVDVDASFLQQCVGNILDNAAKYAYRNTRVCINADVTTTVLTIAVTSTGIPLTARDAQRCLQRNWRGDVARSTTGEGSGLGLWIVDNLMRAMRGHVLVEADADRTIVRLALPLI
jgi:signal transduction histidine kinase